MINGETLDKHSPFIVGVIGLVTIVMIGVKMIFNIEPIKSNELYAVIVVGGLVLIIWAYVLDNNMKLDLLLEGKNNDGE